jgi:CRISPR-associated protein Cas1
MSSLYLDRRNLALKLEGRTLTIYADGIHQTTVPLHMLERVVFYSAVQIESSLFARLADAGITVLAFGGRNAGKVAIIQGTAHNDGTRRIGQYRRYADPDWRRQWSRQLVLGKLKGQARLLHRALDQRADLRHPLTDGISRILQARSRVLSEPELTLESLRGIEGAAAVAYFQALTALFPPGLAFTGRNRRPPRDPVNAVLSLGYTLMHFEAVRACHVAGLDPIIGFFHELDFGRESLASDLIEPWRPNIDAWVWEQFRTRALREDHFTREGDACLLGKTGRQHFYTAYEALAHPLRRGLRRYAGKLAVTLATDGAIDAPTPEQPQ